MSKKTDFYDIPTFHESLKRDYEAGLITIEQAALECFHGGHTNFVDMPYTKRKLGISESKIKLA